MLRRQFAELRKGLVEIGVINPKYPEDLKQGCVYWIELCNPGIRRGKPAKFLYKKEYYMTKYDESWVAYLFETPIESSKPILSSPLHLKESSYNESEEAIEGWRVIYRIK